MLCFSAEETRKYVETSSGIDIIAAENDKQNGLLIDGINYLNSTKVINRCIKKLSELRDYSKAELHKNQEAATLMLKSYT